MHYLALASIFLLLVAMLGVAVFGAAVVTYYGVCTIFFLLNAPVLCLIAHRLTCWKNGNLDISKLVRLHCERVLGEVPTATIAPHRHQRPRRSRSCSGWGR